MEENMEVQTQPLEEEGETEMEQEAIQTLSALPQVETPTKVLPARKMVKATPKGGVGKKSRKTRKLAPQEGAFIHVNHKDPALIHELAQQMRIFLEEALEEDPDKVAVVTGDRVRVLPSKEERLRIDRAKRRIYRNTPNAIAQREKNNKDPVTKKKRQDYANKPEVKERKKIKARIRRATTRKLKENDPETYRLYEQQALNSDTDE